MARRTGTRTETPATDATVETTEETPVTTTETPADETPAPPTGPWFAIGETIITTDTEAAVAAYVAATTGDKTKIRNGIMSAMQSAVMAADIDTAQAWMAVQAKINENATKKATPVTDFNQVVADRVLAFLYAAHRITMGDKLPDGIPADQVDLDKVNTIVQAYLDAGDRDAVSTEVAAAGTKLATTKITRSVERGSVEAHIAAAFADLPVGTPLTVAQIRTRSGAASDGAIAARVWPVTRKGGVVTPTESTLDFHALGVEPTTIDGTRGLIKVSEPAA